MDEKRFPRGPLLSVYPDQREDGVWPACSRPWKNDTIPVIGASTDENCAVDEDTCVFVPSQEDKDQCIFVPSHEDQDQCICIASAEEQDAHICIDSAEGENWNGVCIWDNCCSADRDPCMCITSGEVVRWDGVHDIVSANSAAWNNGHDESWKDSADLWNSASEIVSGHSAYWDSAYSMAQRYDSGAFQDVQNFISATSAFLATYSAYTKVQTDDTLSGNGANLALGLSQSMRKTIEDLTKAANDLYVGGFWGESTKRNWVGMSDIDEIYDWIYKYGDLFFDVSSAYIKNSGFAPAGVFPQLEKIWALLRGTQEWVYNVTSATVSGWNDSADLWNGASMTVKEHSAFWEENTQVVHNHYPEWNTIVNIVSADSAYWNSAYQVIVNSAQYWNSAYHAIINSANNWNSAYHEVSDSADLWNAASMILSSHSAKWDEEADASWKNSAGLWEEASEIVQEQSAYWNSLEAKIAEVAVQTDWEQADSTQLDFLKNKPIPITEADINAIFI